MQHGLVIPNRGTQALDSVRSLPPLAEELGYASAWVTDHVVGVRSFEPVYGAEWLEALSTLAYLAHSTSTIRLGVGVMVVPYRDPVMAAKVLATIDGLSDGRLDVGVGAGWARSEFHGLGAGDLFEGRGAATDEYLDVMVRCWEGGELGWDGDHVAFRRIEFAPRPVQRPHPPLWVGGNTGPALRRAARHATVWHPTNLEPAEVARRGADLDAAAGRAIPRAVRLRIDPAADLAAEADRIAAYADVCAHVAIEVDSDETAVVARWAEAFAERVGLRGAAPVGVTS